MSTALQTVPDLPGFVEFFGIKVSYVGEDGAMIALGHHDKRHALAAFNASAKSKQIGMVDLLDGDGQHAPWMWKEALGDVEHCWAAETRECGECGNDPGCRNCADIKRVWEQGNWWLHWDAKETDPGAFPVTVWRADA